MDLHHQPPDPKAGALLIELQGSELGTTPGLAPGKSVLQTNGSTPLSRNGGMRGKVGRPVGFAPNTTAFTEPDAAITL